MAIGYTPYSQKNQAFSDAAHHQARKDIYPLIFNKPEGQLHYPQLTDAKERDYNMGIDQEIGVDVEGLRAPILFSVQERFRDKRYAALRDLTITEFNQNSGMASELYKIEASMMLYAYFDMNTHRFLEAIVIRIPVFKEYLVRGAIPWDGGSNYRSNQTFCCFKFDDLLNLPGLVKFHKKWYEPQQR